MSMPFTGERYVPEVRGQIYYEHLHRYSLALRLARGVDVLDIASGEGYGSAYLSMVARNVVGVDIDPQSVRHAASRYTEMNLSFRVGSCTHIPLGDASIDLVVSFETVEHIAEHEQFMREILRVLRPDGHLLMSSPNKLVYSDQPNYTNRFHVRELYFDEFRDMLQASFPHCRLYGQRVIGASAIHPLRGVARDARCIGPTSSEEAWGLPALPEPTYFIAVCARSGAAEDLEQLDSIFIDPRDDLVHHIAHPQPLLADGASGQAVHYLQDQGPPAAFGDVEDLRAQLSAGEAKSAVDIGRLEAGFTAERARSETEHASVLGQSRSENAAALEQLQASAAAARDRVQSEYVTERARWEEERTRERDLLRGLLAPLLGDDSAAVLPLHEAVGLAHQQLAAIFAVRAQLTERNTELDALIAVERDVSDDLRARLELTEGGLAEQAAEIASLRSRTAELTAREGASQEREQRAATERNGLVADKQIAERRVAELEASCAQLEIKCEASERRLALGADELRRLESRTAILDAAAASAAARQEALQARVEELTIALRRTTQRRNNDETRAGDDVRGRDATSAQLAATQAQLQDIVSSRSWRMTKPLRLAVKALRRK